MNSIERKLKLLNYENINISTDDFYFMILKIEEEKIRLYKPKERERLNYEKEKNYIEHIIKYLKKLNINTSRIDKQNFNDIEVRTYILNNLTTLALLDDYKDLVNFDEIEDEEEQEEEQKWKQKEKKEKKEKKGKKGDITTSDEKPKEAVSDTATHTMTSESIEEHNNKIKNAILECFFELDYFENIEKEELKNQEKNLHILYEKINQVFKKCNIPLLEDNECTEQTEKRLDNLIEQPDNDKYNNSNKTQKEERNNEYSKFHVIISALLLIKEKLKDKEKVENTNYQEFFGLNIDVNNKELADFVYIIKYLFNELLKNRKKNIKTVLNEIQMLTYNPIIDIKKGKVGR